MCDQFEQEFINLHTVFTVVQFVVMNKN